MIRVRNDGGRRAQPTVTIAVPALRSVAWLEPVTLQFALQRAEGLSDDARARMTPWVRAAQSRWRVARELRDPETQVVALALLREAAFLALSALEHAESQGEVAARSATEVWERFNPPAPGPLGPPEELERVRAIWSEGPLSVDSMAVDEMQKFRGLADSCVAWLLSLAEIRTVAQLRRARVARSLLAIGGGIVVLAGLVAYWISLAYTASHLPRV